MSIVSNLFIMLACLVVASIALGAVTGDFNKSFWSVISAFYTFLKAIAAFGLFSLAGLILSNAKHPENFHPHGMKLKYLRIAAAVLLASLGGALAINLIGNAIDGGVYCDTPMCR